jgi:hypothetical protein
MNKKLLLLLVWLILVVIGTSAANYWVSDPANCPVTNGTNFPGQSCSPTKICGDSSGIAQCYNTSTISAPAGTVTSSTLWTSGFGGGYLLNCFATVDASEPYCDNSGSEWCNRDSSCYTVHRLTSCTGSAWLTFTCGLCVTGYEYCDGSYVDPDGCEVQTGVTAYPGEANANYNSTCGPSCNSGYLDCNGDLGTGGNGCEVQNGGACSVGSVTGTYLGCSCTLNKVPFVTANHTVYASDNETFLWGTNYGSAALVNITNGNTNVSFYVDNETGVHASEFYGDLACNNITGAVSNLCTITPGTGNITGSGSEDYYALWDNSTNLNIGAISENENGTKIANNLTVGGGMDLLKIWSYSSYLLFDSLLSYPFFFNNNVTIGSPSDTGVFSISSNSSNIILDSIIERDFLFRGGNVTIGDSTGLLKIWLNNNAVEFYSLANKAFYFTNSADFQGDVSADRFVADTNITAGDWFHGKLNYSDLQNVPPTPNVSYAETAGVANYSQYVNTSNLDIQQYWNKSGGNVSLINSTDILVIKNKIVGLGNTDLTIFTGVGDISSTGNLNLSAGQSSTALAGGNVLLVPGTNLASGDRGQIRLFGNLEFQNAQSYLGNNKITTISGNLTLSPAGIVVVSTNLSADNFFGSINWSWIQNVPNYLTSWLVPDTTNGYLYNDSTKIYFNESKLNETIDNKISGAGTVQLLASVNVSTARGYTSIYNVPEGYTLDIPIKPQVQFLSSPDVNALFVYSFGSNYSEVYDHSAPYTDYSAFDYTLDYTLYGLNYYYSQDIKSHSIGGLMYPTCYKWLKCDAGSSFVDGVPYWLHGIPMGTGNSSELVNVSVGAINASGINITAIANGDGYQYLLDVYEYGTGQETPGQLLYSSYIQGKKSSGSSTNAEVGTFFYDDYVLSNITQVWNFNTSTWENYTGNLTLDNKNRCANLTTSFANCNIINHPYFPESGNIVLGMYGSGDAGDNIYIAYPNFASRSITNTYHKLYPSGSLMKVYSFNQYDPSKDDDVVQFRLYGTLIPN